MHKQTVVVCARVAGEGPLRPEVRTYSTTSALVELADLLESFSVEYVVIETTGMYWKLVWHLLEGHIELIPANAAHVKNVPGCKTDVADATWQADLQAHGLIRASFAPRTAVQELRTLTRTRRQFVRERGSLVQRIEKILEDANLKLSVVFIDIMGKSGRAELRALMDGHAKPAELLRCVEPDVKVGRAELLEALRGRVSAYHRLLLRVHLGHIEALDRAIAEIEREVRCGL